MGAWGRMIWIPVLCWVFLIPAAGARQDGAVSSATRGCLACHETVTPGIVADWQNSRMAQTTPAMAMEKPVLQRRISAENVPEPLAGSVVGCAECHTLRPGKHADTFRHGGADVHPVVTPDDCAVCHREERKQFSDNLMSAAHGNLMDNSLYDALITAVNGPLAFSGPELRQSAPGPETNADACLFCHGTRLAVEDTAARKTPLGLMDFPVIRGWPNQGVGRVNPDKSTGTCSACHPRHRFSIETARKPETCSQCHKGPDVPAYKVYCVSKHGNIYSATKESGQWDFSAVPWTVGKDMEAPTCAACHMSLLCAEDGRIIAERTHRVNDRLAWRIFGLPYAHPHPESADTTAITSKDGLPLPTALDGTPATDFLISAETRDKRSQAMQAICLGCHTTGWVRGHFSRLSHTIEETSAQTLAATRILQKAWDTGAASGPDAGASPFDEALERMWVESWLFYANSTRFASAMGGADYGVFARGRWYLTRNIHEMAQWLELKTGGKER